MYSHLPIRDRQKFKLKSFGKRKPFTKVDFFISVGGDGTLLESVTYVGKSGVPILGINTGRMGFLATTHRAEVTRLSKIFSKANSRSTSVFCFDSIQTKIFSTTCPSH
ncbi:MAG: NAD(+)/NADH kinase [Bacteroidota bacterium]